MHYLTLILVSHFHYQSRLIFILTYWVHFDVRMSLDSLITSLSMWTSMSTNSDDLPASCTPRIFVHECTIPKGLTRCAGISTTVYLISSILLWPLKFASDSVLNSNVFLHLRCLMGMSLAIRTSKGFERGKSPILTFLDFLFIVLWGTVLWDDKRSIYKICFLTLSPNCMKNVFL